MLRLIAGVIVGFMVMAVLVMATFAVTMLAFGGLEHTLQPGTYWTTNTFNIIVMIGGFIGAIIGGLVCALIARNAMAAYVLVAIVLAMGIGSAAMNMNKPDPPARLGAATLEDMMTHGKEPTWFAISKTISGALGLLIGAALVRNRTPTAG